MCEVVTEELLGYVKLRHKEPAKDMSNVLHEKREGERKHR